MKCSNQCTCSPEQEVDCSQTLSLDTGQLSLSNITHIDAKSSENESKTNGGQVCECGRGTLDCSIHPGTPDAWISSMRDSLARILASPVVEQALMVKEVAFMRKSSELQAWYDRDTCSLRTAQLSLLEDSTESSVTLSGWGMWDGTGWWQLPTLALRMEGLGGGALLNVPTPTVCGNYNRKGASKTSGDGLATFVRKFPTPTATAKKGSSENALTRKDGRSRISDRLDHYIMAMDGGQLNPPWVEWLMGWPIGHTELKHSGTAKFRSKRRSRGKS